MHISCTNGYDIMYYQDWYNHQKNPWNATFAFRKAKIDCT